VASISEFGLDAAGVSSVRGAQVVSPTMLGHF
jgi:hypothetical protein